MKNSSRIFAATQNKSPLSVGCFAVASIFWLLSNSTTCLAQDEGSGQERESFVAKLRNADTVEVALEDVKFDWLTVALDGASSIRKVSASDIAELTFATQPASGQVAEMRGVISLLGDDDYDIRQAAEERLTKEGVPFIQLLEEAEDSLDIEQSYRVARLLKFLRKEAKSGTEILKLEFDKIVLNSGESIEGDIGEFAFNCKWKNGKISLDRENCELLIREDTTPKPELTAVSLPAATEIKVTSMDESSAFLDGENVKGGFQFEGFEEDQDGQPLPRSASGSTRTIAAYKGLLLESGNKIGMAIVAGYKFKRSRSGSRGITNRFLDQSGGNEKWKPYRGVSRLAFCVPGFENEPATVDSISVMLEITKPKHTVLEAYNAAGHIVGLIYSGDIHTSTVGLTSNDRIAYVLVHPNSYFDPPPKKLNFDFAIDDVYYSDPVWAPELNMVADDVTSRKFLSKDGKRMNVKSFKFDKASNAVLFEGTKGVQDFSVPMADIDWLLGPQKYPRPNAAEDGAPPENESAAEKLTESAAFVMLQDGSVALCEFKDGPQVLGSEIRLDPKEIVGVWGRQATARYPQAGDFKFGKLVMVRPLNRIGFASDAIDWKTGLFKFSLPGAKNIEQLVEADKPQPIKEDPKDAKTTANAKEDVVVDEQPKGELIDQRLISDAGLADVLGSAATEPTAISLVNTQSLWLAPPKSRDPNSGLLRLLDGQQFVLGNGENSFKLVELNGENITIEKQGNKITITTDKVAAFQVPK